MTDTTLYLERSKVREILIGHNAATQAVLPKIDALPILTAADIAGVAQGPAKPVGRRWIVDLIRDQFDPKPSDYRPGDNWDDGAEAIADAVLAQLPLLRAEGSVAPSTEGQTRG